MREILYKAKRTDSDEWVYGAFVPDATEPAYGDMVTWGFIRRYNEESGKMESVEVERETVCEYTGRGDIDGNKIFEHDMVKLGYLRADKSVAWYGAHEVVFRDGAYMIGGEPLCNLGKYIRLKRIGNICEKREE
jgi:hypothetical protein